MKHRDLIGRINKIARERGETAVFTEGGSHTKVAVGDLLTTIPRHKEIKEPLARKIIADIEEN